MHVREQADMITTMIMTMMMAMVIAMAKMVLKMQTKVILYLPFHPDVTVHGFSTKLIKVDYSLLLYDVRTIYTVIFNVSVTYLFYIPSSLCCAINVKNYYYFGWFTII